MNTVNAFGKFSSICRSLNMEQGGSTGGVPLETLNCRVDLTDLLRNIKEEEYANKVEIDDEEATSAEDLLAEELLGALERNEALHCKMKRAKLTPKAKLAPIS